MEDIGLNLDMLNPTKEEGGDTQDVGLLEGFSGETMGIPIEEDLFAKVEKEDTKKEEGTAKGEEPDKKPEDKPEDEKKPDDEEGAEQVTVAEKGDEKKDDKKKESDPYLSVAEVLQDQGAIKEIPEDFDKSPEGLGKLFTDEVDRVKDEWVDSLPEAVKYFIDNWKEGVPLANLLEREASIESYKAIDKDSLKDNESMQKALVRDYLTRQDWSETEIKEEIEEIETSGNLESKSKRFLDKLIKQEEEERNYYVAEEKKKKQVAEKNYDDQLKALKKNIDGKKEIIPGVKLNDRDKKKLFDGITRFDANRKNEIQRVREANPDFDLAVAALAILYGGKMDKLSVAATTKVTKELKGTLDEETGGEKKPSLKGVDTEVIKKAVQAWKF